MKACYREAKTEAAMGIKRIRQAIQITSTRGIFARTQVRVMSSEERAYVGAMLDGEGCIHWGAYGEQRTPRPDISFSNTDTRIIIRLREFLGTGHDYCYPKQGKPLHRLYVIRLADIWSLCLQVQQYSFKAAEAIGHIAETYGVLP